MSEWTVDLSELPAPKVVEDLSFEEIRDAMLDHLKDLDPVFEDLKASDPARKVIEAAAYRELLLRQRVNDAARSVMLAYAEGADLDNLAALFDVERQDEESDDDLRDRVRLSLSALSVAGPKQAYIFHARSADDRVKDAAVTSPEPGKIDVVVLSTEGDGAASQRETVTEQSITLNGDAVTLDGQAITDLVVQDSSGDTTYSQGTDYTFQADDSRLMRVEGGDIEADAELTVSYEKAGLVDLVKLALTDEDVRPITDDVSVRSAEIIPYQIKATLKVGPTADASIVSAEALKRVADYTDNRHRVGERVTITSIHHALTVPGVIEVLLDAPAANIDPGSNEAPFADDIDLSVEVG